MDDSDVIHINLYFFLLILFTFSLYRSMRENICYIQQFSRNMLSDIIVLGQSQMKSEYLWQKVIHLFYIEEKWPGACSQTPQQKVAYRY